MATTGGLRCFRYAIYHEKESQMFRQAFRGRPRHPARYCDVEAEKDPDGDHNHICGSLYKVGDEFDHLVVARLCSITSAVTGHERKALISVAA